MGPLIAAGTKKPLDLTDVPQLDSHDSVIGAFPNFKNRLQSADSEGNCVTSGKLVKALFFSAWKDILWTALFTFTYTLASYVGPYLIDTFVQYLNGQREFKAEGYLLVAAFFVAKLVECLSQRRRLFKLQQVGLRQRALLVAMIYNKGLTLSCQVKQSHTSGKIINFMTVDAERVGDFSWYMHDPWMVALQVGLALLILYKTLGLASIAAFVANILVMLANIPLRKMLEKFHFVLDTIKVSSVSEQTTSEGEGDIGTTDGRVQIEENQGNESDIKPPVGSFTLIIVYLALAITSVVCVLAISMLIGTAGYKTATLLFKKMHLCIFRAPMSFFDSTPSGRILNRASTDQSTVYKDIPYQVAAFAFSVIQLLGIIAVISQVAWNAHKFVISQQYYISFARELLRLVGVCKAPILQNFTETILGATTIKSFDQEKRFQDTNMALTDLYSRLKFHVAGAIEWLFFRLDLLSSVTFTFSLFILISIPVGVIHPAIAGLAVTYGLNLNILQASMVWNICKTENKIISVERILQYCSIPSEPALVVETNRPDHCWPYHGEVRYAPHMPLVLRGLTCTFPGGLKTGIVGRTGSGKSTLIQTIFQIVEPAARQIIIDGVSISTIGLHDLCSRLGIIPPEPTMFEGTIRSNLDPLEEYTDEQIWKVVCLLLHKLYFNYCCAVSENGENWSMGQRQLVCLGHVLLKKSKILVLDEATASVDTATDNLIQMTDHFSDCTVITIAHRITSVLDSDMVLLLSHGVIEEYDSPSSLLENKSSSFAQLVAEYTVRPNPGF
ncbi:hypothetical protein J1N35_023514 [Gossypium stocksii]|uniref:ABC-type xenobiotic transporter n=1 Tax=Gossypium stocksii TaxID=47602 RepID=A0A9D4A395_9ROSI|nr:hypothetical protein J1N35_023514 [Gossypium stocksii]